MCKIDKHIIHHLFLKITQKLLKKKKKHNKIIKIKQKMEESKWNGQKSKSKLYIKKKVIY
mgnify:FL=1